MTVDEIKDLIDQGAALGTKSVVFTGGEPTLLGPKLNTVIQHVRTAGVASSRIVTNAAWAKTYDRARELLADWQESGLLEINVSCGEYHLEFVPMSNIVNAYNAAVDLDYLTVLLVAEVIHPSKGKVTEQTYRAALKRNLMPTSLMSPFSSVRHGVDISPAMPYGRGAKELNPDDLIYHEYDEIKSTCSEVLRTITLHPNGNVTACCGVMSREDSLLTLGNWRQERLKTILERAQQDVVLNWVKYVGLKDMREWLQKQDAGIDFKPRYQNICDLCADVFQKPRCQELLTAGGAERAGQVLVHKVAQDVTLYGRAGLEYREPDPA